MTPRPLWTAATTAFDLIILALPFITAFTNLQQMIKQQQDAHQLSKKGRPPSLRAAPHLPPRAIGRVPCTLERSPSSLEA